MEEENKKIMEFARLQQIREQERLSKKKEKDASMAKVQDAVSYIFYYFFIKTCVVTGHQNRLIEP